MTEPEIKGQGPLSLISDVDKKRLEKVEDAKTRRDNDIRMLMNTAGNRRVVQEILDFCGAYRNAYVPDSDQSIYNLGLKAVGLKIMEMIGSVCPEKILQMQQEGIAQKIQDSKEANKPEEN
jgi:hypothetical protein